MRSHAWKAGSQAIALGRFVKEFDATTRGEGFHVLNDWDGKADRVNEDTIPVDVLNYLIARRGGEPPDAAVLAILLDYYFANLLALLCLRIWDEGDADANLDRLNALVQMLQGPNGSGQRFAADAETLILIGTSHFEAVEVGYEKLLARVRTLNRSHQTNIALGHAVSMGSHLRFGFEATYGRDTVVMRDDNVADYPWLCFALVTVMREYARARETDGARGRPRPPRRSARERPLLGSAGVHRPGACVALEGRSRSVRLRRTLRDLPRRPAAGIRNLPSARRCVLAAVVLLQLLAQRAERHCRGRAAARQGVGRVVQRSADAFPQDEAVVEARRSWRRR